MRGVRPWGRNYIRICMRMHTQRRAAQQGAAWLVVLVVLAVGLAAYGGYRWSKRLQARAVAAAELGRLEDFDAKLAPILRRWGDAYRLAVSSPRIAVSQHIAVMQAAVRDLDELPRVQCVSDQRADVRRVLQTSVDGMLAFVQQDIGARALIDQVEVEAGPVASAMRSAKADCAKALQAKAE